MALLPWLPGEGRPQWGCSGAQLSTPGCRWGPRRACRPSPSSFTDLGWRAVPLPSTRTSFPLQGRPALWLWVSPAPGDRGPGRSTGPAQSSCSVCGTAGYGLAHGHSSLGAWRRVRPGTAGGPAHGICLFLLLCWFWFALPSSAWESGVEVEPALGSVAERAGTRGAGC